MRSILFILVLLISMTCLTLGAQDFAAARRNMVKNQIEARGIGDARVLDAMLKIERHLFVPKDLRSQAYADRPLPIGEGQTISQPYIVALMTEALGLSGKERVLEIGTGSGYQAAVLSLLAKEVCTIEIKKPLYDSSKGLLSSLGLKNVSALCGDGYFGWKERAPFDCIMITAAVDFLPPPLFEQLKDGGRIILPLGNPFSYQNLVLITKKGNDKILEYLTGVLFVPMTGEALKGRE